jgi:hypothetical protein
MIALLTKIGVSVVTGGTRGIGKATALKLAELGSDIAIIYNNKG